MPSAILMTLTALMSVIAPARAAEAIAQAGPGERVEWRFAVGLDGKPIGSHHFSLEAMPGSDTRSRRLVSDAEFRVTLLGVPLYRYRHHAEERWQGDCLVALSASTDDDGKRIAVRGEAKEDRFDVRSSTEEAAASARLDSSPGCATSFAYWLPSLRKRSPLLNPQTGRFEAVTFAPLPSRDVEVEGRAVTAQGWRLAGAGAPIDLWYSGEGRWIGLDTTVSGGRRLSYRLPAITPSPRP